MNQIAKLTGIGGLGLDSVLPVKYLQLVDARYHIHTTMHSVTTLMPIESRIHYDSFVVQSSG